MNELQDSLEELKQLYFAEKWRDLINRSGALVEKYPQVAVIWNILGIAHSQIEEFDRAISVFKQVLKLNPRFPEGHNNLGSAFRQNSDLENAEIHFKLAIELNPNYLDAYLNLGNLYVDRKDYVESIKIFKSALLMNPESCQVHNALGNVYMEIGNFQDALRSVEHAISINPEYVEAYNSKGSVYLKEGRLQEAIEYFNKAISLKPEFSSAHNNLGKALIESDNMDTAAEAIKRALAFDPNNAESYNNLAIVLRANSRFDEAMLQLEKAVELMPGFYEAHLNMGIIYRDLGKLDLAVQKLQNVLMIYPKHTTALLNLGIVLIDQQKFDQAIEVLENFILLEPKSDQGYLNLGVAFQKLGDIEKAIKAFSLAIELKPNSALAHNNLGTVYKEKGLFKAAKDAFQKAINLDPDFAFAHRNLSTLVQYQADNPQIICVSKLLESPSLDEEERCNLLYTNAKINEDLGEFKSALKSYIEAGKLRKKNLQYRRSDDLALFQRIKLLAQEIKDLSHEKSTLEIGKIPIFIVGMPRSGTTLVEQVLSCHSNVYGAGELPLLGQFGYPVHKDGITLSTQKLENFRTKYLQDITGLSGNCRYLTDKMPENFLFLAIVFNWLPEAKIIHVRRDPFATCWSNFKTYFAGRGLGYSYDLGDTVAFYQMYVDLMEFWETNNPNRIYHFDYESFTLCQEKETRRLIEFIGLEWQEECLFPQKNKRVVRTASQQQVKRAVYTGSSNAWRNYLPYLDGAFDPLN